MKDETMDKPENVQTTRVTWRKKLSLVVAAVIIAFGVAELGVRVRQLLVRGAWSVPGWLRYSHPATSVYHPFLRGVPKPSASHIEVQGEDRAKVKINSLGFRSQEIKLAKPEGTFRIVCVGGSVVYDTRLNLEDAWATRLQEKLGKKFPGRSIEVVNAGIPGRTSADSVVNVALRVLPLSPDVVIVLHGVNDQKPNRYPGFKPDYSHWYPFGGGGPWRRMLNRLADRSLLACHVRYRVNHLRNRNLRENWRGEEMKRHDTVGEAGLRAYRLNLESIIGMCSVQGAKVVIGTVGHSLDENDDWNPGMGTRNPLVYYHEGLTLAGIRHGFREYNRINREVAKERCCVLVDIEKLLPVGKENFKDDVHFTATGALNVAEIFVTQVPGSEMIK